MAANPFATLGKLGDLKRRLWFLLAALVVYRIGAHIPVPGIDPNELTKLFNQNRGGILDMFNMFSGGALSRFTIFALGIMPYISASIIMQLLTVVSPQLEALKKEGESGRRKITQYTRYGTVVLSLFQALGISVALESQPAALTTINWLRRSSRWNRQLEMVYLQAERAAYRPGEEAPMFDMRRRRGLFLKLARIRRPNDSAR